MSNHAVLHTSRVPVRWGDMDSLGHVNNATYLSYAEQARIEWLDAAFGSVWPDDGGPILASISAEYHRPVHFPATIEVDVLSSEVGRTSFHQGYQLRVGGETVCEINAVLVWVSRAVGRPVPLPESLRSALGG